MRLDLVIDKKLRKRQREKTKQKNSRLFCLRKPRVFRVRKDILQVFFLVRRKQRSSLWACLLGRKCFKVGQRQAGKDHEKGRRSDRQTAGHF